MPIEQFYFPSKALTFVNFPEVRTYSTDIQTIMAYEMRASLAMSDYNSGRYDRIDLNRDDLQFHINLCRTVSQALGMAPNICFDILLEIRTVQETLQNILYLQTKFGSKIVGNPTNATSEGGGGV